MNKCISNKLKFYNWILTIGVVAYHSNLNSGYDISNTILNVKILNVYNEIISILGIFVMYNFFFLSGFWFWRGISTIHDVKKKYLKRVYTVLQPYLMWTIVILLFERIFSYNNVSTINFRSLCDIFFLDPIDGPLWYLLALMIIQSFSPIIYFISKNKKIFIIFTMFIICYISLRIMGYVPTIIAFNNWWWYGHMICYLPSYFLGALVGLYYSDIILKREYTNKICLLLGLLLICISITFKYVIMRGGSNYIIELISMNILSIGGWLIIDARRFEKDIPKIIDSSFYVYATHSPIFIPVTTVILTKMLQGICVNSIEMIIIKLIQVALVIVGGYITKMLFNIIFSERLYFGFSGGRGL
ncbi:Acyltransferase family protein [Pseudobutyrivibrio sp. UC1225]|uniref:acyltransferase family protein n=1 Tax=Pseudobutyrivibrio sp. UC1225 TaxID=1798185 RepID=UPI0008EF9E04|nr:acyltransferase [Pseudobutyrivibrio sp. UC1225]SFO21935.1 Acyltransferase family protein [Pseudobutyrivibrio sp. UC1225]